MSKKIWNCLPLNLGILKLSVLINQKIFKTVYRIFLKTVLIGHDGHSQQMWASPVNPSSTIKETIVLDGKYIFSLSKNCLFYIFFDRICGRTSAHIFRICSVQNCLPQVKISETVYSLCGFWNCLCGFWNCLSWKGQTNGFLFAPE